MNANRFVEQSKTVWGAEPKNYTGAAMTAKYVSLKNYDRLRIIISTGAWAGGTAAVTLSQATAIAGTSAKALGMSFVWITASGADTPTKTTVASNTFNLDTANQVYYLEVVASDLDVDNGFDCVTLAVASPGGNNDFYSVVYDLVGARYPQPITPTSILD